MDAVFRRLRRSSAGRERAVRGASEAARIFHRTFTPGSAAFKDVEIPRGDAAAQAAAAEAEPAFRTAGKRGDALVAEPAGDKEISAVPGEPDRAADAPVVGGGGHHQGLIRRADAAASFTGAFVTDCGDLLLTDISAAVRVEPVSEDRVGHFREYEEHSGVSRTEGEVSGAGAVRQADAAAGIPKPAGRAVKLIDIDCIEAQVADEDFVSFRMESGEVGVRALLAVSGIKTRAAVLTEVAEGADTAVAVEIVEGDAPAHIIGAEKELAALVHRDVAGTCPSARK